jgi:3-(3-hydroxy-phenyl)propionate hydroxylase
MADVIIAGGGPTGMMLAGELALAGVEAVIVERRATPELVGSRAGGFHSRTIEVLDQRGIADRFLAEGTPVQAAFFGTTKLDMSDFPTRHPFTLGLWQNRIERILAGWIGELGVDIQRGCEVAVFTQDDAGVDVQLSDGKSIRALFLVGADGGRSAVRKAAGIDFPGWDATRSSLIAEVEVTDETPAGMRIDEVGVHGLHLMEDGRTTRVVVTEKHLGPAAEPTLADLSKALTDIFGTDFGVHAPTWISRFTDATRQAAAYRSGRVLLAGDAAHIHSPSGGQGIGLGIQDAVNLGWKLAQVVKGTAPDSLLDTYHAERHAAGARALKHTMAQAVMQRTDPRVGALADTVAGLLDIDAARKRIAGLISGLDVRYDFGEGHPLLGRRMPDLDVVTSNGTQRVFSLLHGARAALLNFGAPGSIGVGPWGDRVQVVDAAYDGAWELPVIGSVSAPAAALIRPDGYVAWTGDGTRAGLEDALARWFGPGQP